MKVRPMPKLLNVVNKPHFILDGDYNVSIKSGPSSTLQPKPDVLHLAESLQFRSAMESSSAGNACNFPKKSYNAGSSMAHHQRHQQQEQQQQPSPNQDRQTYKFGETGLDRPLEKILDSHSSGVYHLERAVKKYFDNPKRYAQ